ncbi:MAG: LPS export ABC transporter periplasmic protein LptC [Balneolaceae bacterium]|nr:LPS export ABC transporter periplasmic protein LptC [Balneolaceae bacterium]
MTRGTAISTPSDALRSFLLAALLAAFGFGLSSCNDLSSDQVQQINEALNDSLTSSTEAWDVEIAIMEKERTKARLTGSYAATYTRGDSSRTHIDGPVHIDVYDSTGAVTTRVRSDRAIYRAATLHFEFFGDVQVETDEGRTLSSEYLRWNQGENTIDTPRFVVVTTPTDTLAGTGLTGTADLSSVTLHDARGSITLD